ncbi:phosphatidylcholine and lysophosphatidylcholine phospholipase, partial [Teratosphaeriaceae sp. CCFEE 6253]
MEEMLADLSRVLPHASSSLTQAIGSATTTAAGASTTIIYVPAQPQSALGMIAGLLLGLFTVVPSLLYWLITFVTLTLPTWLFTFLSTSLTFTMNMTTLLLMLLGFASTVAWFVRYRFLNMYSRLPPEPQRKEPQIEIFPDAPETDSKPGLANYFDEFLSAIKVFGYLERPVFHELTRTMQTRKLIAGETLLLEEEKGFCLVVDGLVQIFVKSQKAPEHDWSHDSHESDDHGDERSSGNRSYQLLTEVKNGAPMSSLFSILALFTENVKLRYGEAEQTPPNTSREAKQHPRFPFPSIDGSATPDSSVESPWAGGTSRPTSRHRSTSTMKEPPLLTLDGSDGLHINVHGSRQSSTTRPQAHRPSRHQKHSSAHPDIVARAAVDTTIAVIPASAFHRITKMYPKATAHIVQVIITRLQRVTLGTVHSYLGLTSEVLSTERLLDKYTTYDLPDFLRGEVQSRLKDKFRKDQERLGTEESMK